MANGEVEHDVGANWVTNPNRDLHDIEAEFDATAHLYEGVSTAWSYRAADDGVAHLMKLCRPDDDILDAGCGTGLVGARLGQLGYSRLTGCDISAEMIKIAEKKDVYPGGISRSDIRHMPFTAKTFDTVVCIAVLTYAPDISAVFDEFNRVVKTGGLVFFSHRTDLELSCGFRESLDRLVADKRWVAELISDPMLYYPGREDYGTKILVRYYGFRVSP